MDNRIIAVIKSKKYDELNKNTSLQDINYNNAVEKYYEYLKVIDCLSNCMSVQPERIEMFLFIFGLNLS